MRMIPWIELYMYLPTLLPTYRLHFYGTTIHPSQNKLSCVFKRYMSISTGFSTQRRSCIKVMHFFFLQMSIFVGFSVLLMNSSAGIIGLTFDSQIVLMFSYFIPHLFTISRISGFNGYKLWTWSAQEFGKNVIEISCWIRCRFIHLVRALPSTN